MKAFAKLSEGIIAANKGSFKIFRSGILQCECKAYCELIYQAPNEFTARILVDQSGENISSYLSYSSIDNPTKHFPSYIQFTGKREGYRSILVLEGRIERRNFSFNQTDGSIDQIFVSCSKGAITEEAESNCVTKNTAIYYISNFLPFQFMFSDRGFVGDEHNELLEWDFGDYSVSLYRIDIKSKVKFGFQSKRSNEAVINAVIIVKWKGKKNSWIRDTEGVVKNLCNLLSLAMHSKVDYIRKEYYTPSSKTVAIGFEYKKILGKSRYVEVVPSQPPGIPVCESSSGIELWNFINKAVEENRSTLNFQHIGNAIDYFVQSQHSDSLIVKYSLAFLALESAIKIYEMQFRKPPLFSPNWKSLVHGTMGEKIRELVSDYHGNLTSRQKSRLVRKLSECNGDENFKRIQFICSKLNISGFYREHTKIRNKIFHEGCVVEFSNDGIELYYHLLNYVTTQILLRYLGHDGFRMWSYTGRQIFNAKDGLNFEMSKKGFRIIPKGETHKN